MGASNTGQFLSDLGQYERVMGAGTWIMVSTKQGRQWVEVTLPPYIAHGRKVTGPYLDFAAAKGKEVATNAREGLALLLSGKVDWSAVKIQIGEAVEVAQMQLLAAANYVQLQLKQLVK